MGRPKSMDRAMAPPRISARAVATAASTAEPRSARDRGLGRWRVAASERQRPVAMPRWAALCWRTMSMTVDRLTIQSSS
jgi:hypothetical protein